MTAVTLRQWRGVKPSAGPPGASIVTRLRVTSADEVVLDAVAGHLGRLRRADLAAVSHPEPHALKLDAAERQVRRDGPNARKRDLTALSSARWANAIISANDAQYRSVREAQDRHFADLRAAIEAIAKRLSQPTVDMLTVRSGRRGRRPGSRRDTRPRPSGSRSSGDSKRCGPNSIA